MFSLPNVEWLKFDGTICFHMIIKVSCYFDRSHLSIRHEMAFGFQFLEFEESLLLHKSLESNYFSDFQVKYFTSISLIWNVQITVNKFTAEFSCNLQVRKM